MMEQCREVDLHGRFFYSNDSTCLSINYNCSLRNLSSYTVFAVFLDFVTVAALTHKCVNNNNGHSRESSKTQEHD
jgi:hypothetical protein